MNKKVIPIMLVSMMLISSTVVFANLSDSDTATRTQKITDDYCSCNTNSVDTTYNPNLFPTCPVMTIPPTYLDPSKASPKPQCTSTPSEFSWKNISGSDWTTPVKNQGNCGSCWDFAATGALESIINIREGCPSLDPDLSEQYVISCLPDAGSCGGGDMVYMYHLINETSGIIPETCLPYEAVDTIPCSAKCDNWEELLVPINNFGYWHPNGSPQDREAIKSQIMQHGPIATYIMATEDFVQWGLAHHSPTDYYPHAVEDWPNHCVVLVGWKDDPTIPHGGYWIVKNSWGTYWGYDGWFNIEYGSLCIDDWEIVWVDYDPDDFNWPPVAQANGPYAGHTAQEVTFTANGSVDPEGAIVSYQWDFGDDTNGTGVTTTHAYEQRGIYTVTLTVIDASGKQGIKNTSALIDLWKTNDQWTFTIDTVDIQLNQSGQNFSLKGSVDTLDTTITDTSGDTSVLAFNGKFTGEFQATLTSEETTYNLKGKITKLTTLSGSVIVRQSDLAIQEITGTIFGLLIILEHPLQLQIPIPVPGRINVRVTFNPPYHVFDFPLASGKLWDIPPVNISVHAEVKSIWLFLLNLFNPAIPRTIVFDKSANLPAIPSLCVQKETVTVAAGTYTAYNVTIFDMLKYYFAPETGNIVKASVALTDMIKVQGELTSTNYVP